jgi:hypothetical protein
MLNVSMCMLIVAIAEAVSWYSRQRLHLSLITYWQKGTCFSIIVCECSGYVQKLRAPHALLFMKLATGLMMVQAKMQIQQILSI